MPRGGRERTPGSNDKPTVIRSVPKSKLGSFRGFCSYRYVDSVFGRCRTPCLQRYAPQITVFSYLVFCLDCHGRRGLPTDPSVNHLVSLGSLATNSLPSYDNSTRHTTTVSGLGPLATGFRTPPRAGTISTSRDEEHFTLAHSCIIRETRGDPEHKGPPRPLRSRTQTPVSTHFYSVFSHRSTVQDLVPSCRRGTVVGTPPVDGTLG